MDVSFTNVLEGARQYFQGLPAGTGATSGPKYSSTSENDNAPNQSESNMQDVGYWTTQHDMAGTPTREHSPNQRPSSLQSDSSRPPSHHSQVGYSPLHDQSRIQSHNPYHSMYQEQAQCQSFQFSRPHSREAPSNVSQQQQNYQHYQPYTLPSTTYLQSSPPQQPSPQPPSHQQPSHQQPSPQQPSPQQPTPQQLRTPSRHSDHNMTNSLSSQSYTASPQSYRKSPSSQSFSSSQSYTSLTSSQSYTTPLSSEPYQQSPQSYHSYQQNRLFYPVHSQAKSQFPSAGASQKTAVSHSCGATAQDSSYYKASYSYSSHNPTHVPSPLVDASEASPHHHQNSNSQQEMEYNHAANVLQTRASSKGYSTTHNLPPIASLSSVNYHSNRSSRDTQKFSTSRTRTTSSGAQAFMSGSTQSLQSTEILGHRTSNSSILQQGTVQMPSTFPSGSQVACNNPASYSSHVRDQNHQYVTTTTQSYSQVNMTTSSVSSYSLPTQPSSSKPPHYQSSKIQPTLQQAQRARFQTPVTYQQTIQPDVITHIDLTGNTANGTATPVIKHRRESPLDLSVKTVRTSADSTHEDAEQDVRQKNATNQNTGHQSVSLNSYSNIDSFQRNQRTTQTVTATAPKVDFLPDFSLTHTHGVHRTEPRRCKAQVLLEKTSSNQGTHFEKLSNQQQNQPYSVNRYPTVSIPSTAHVSTYMQTHSSAKRPSENAHYENLPRIDFPGQLHKTPAVYSMPAQNPQRKRTADTAPSMIPSKIIKVDNWKQTIDQQIEQRFSSYKQQQEQRHSLQNRTCTVNGYVQRNDEKSTKDQRPNQVGSRSYNMSYTNLGQYQPQTSLSQTYVPTVSGHQYQNYISYTSGQHQQHSQPHQQHPRINSSLGLNMNGPKNKISVGGAANKHVLSLLRNSLEIKGAKEAQKKLEQEQLCKTYENFHSRPGIQQPSTDVTAPLQPKPGMNGRQNISPFTPTNLPESNFNTTPYKIHIPRAVDSVNFDTDAHNTSSFATEKQTDDNPDMVSNQSNYNTVYDGLAAFIVAARIRTKAELKQVGPALTHNSSNIPNSSNYTCNNNNNSHLHNIIENQLITPVKEEIVTQETTPNSTTSSSSVSPPKLVKEKQIYSPRRRLFSRNEDDLSGLILKAPPRDKSGLRSSSETSIFDFPDSDSDGEMPILERQSLEDMRRDRKSNTKVTNTEIKSEEPSRPPSPGDDVFYQACDNFMEELKTNVGKKRGRRKKGMDLEVLAMLEETVTKEKPVDEVKIKLEIESEQDNVENISGDISNDKMEAGISLKTSEDEAATITEKVEDNNIVINEIVSRDKVESNDSSVIKTNKKSTDNNGQETTSNEFIDDAPEINIEIKVEKASRDCKKDCSKSLPINNKDGHNNDKVIIGSVQTEVPLVIRPAKKPTFGDGSDFYPGWEEEVCRYKKSLRMPPSLIQITRPPQCHRLSTSLPDLDPCRFSPIDHGEFSKNKMTKIKSEPVDSDVESNSSFNLFNNKNNYDSEGSSSVVSLPNIPKENTSIVDKLYERYSVHKRRRSKKKDEKPKLIPKSDSDLLATPSLEIKTKDDSDLKTTDSVITSESALLGFRKKTLTTFKDTFIKAKKIVGVNEHLTTVVLNSRTRKETKILKQRATIKEVFGEDRPASAPPDTCVNEVKVKEELKESVDKEYKSIDVFSENRCDFTNTTLDTKLVLKNRLLNKDRKRRSNLLKALVEKKIKTELKEESEDKIIDGVVIKEEPDRKSETPSLDGNESSNSSKKKNKFRSIRRKGSSGFDYIRKKKRHSKKDSLESDPTVKYKKRSLSKSHPESIQDIQKEIKAWVLNKGVGETLIHRAARLGYADVTAYCLEKLDYSPSVRDNAGVTPLHVASMRGHLDIVRLLLSYGANPGVQASGGMR